MAFRRLKWSALAVGCTLIAGGIAWLLHPVCVAIPREELANFEPPIEAHTERNLIGQLYFQKDGDDWYHCKTWIERALFF